MFGDLVVERFRVALEMPKWLVDTLDEYCAGLIAGRSRNSIITEACVDYLRAHGVTIPPPGKPDATDASDF